MPAFVDPGALWFEVAVRRVWGSVCPVVEGLVVQCGRPVISVGDREVGVSESEAQSPVLSGRVETTEVDGADGVRVLALIGEHDMASVDDLGRMIMEHARSKRNVVVSLRESLFIDSTIVALLYRSHSLMQEAGLQLVILSNPAANVHRLLEMTSLLKVVPTAETLEHALGLAGREPSS